MAPRLHVTDIPDELLVRIAEFASRAGGQRMLTAMALVSRAFNRAATQVLYRTLCLCSQLQARTLLGMLEECDTNGTYSPPLLGLVIGFSSHKNPKQLRMTERFLAALAARIMDACPNTRHLHTTSDILFAMCQSQREYETLFLEVNLLAHWGTLMDSSSFSHLKRLHININYDIIYYHSDLLVFAPSNFPVLAYFSVLIGASKKGVPMLYYEPENVKLLSSLCGDIICGIPELRRFVLWIPCYVDEFQRFFRPLLLELCRFKDDRVCIAEGMDGAREFPMWKAYVEGRVDPWAFGKPVAQLL
ncbi:hypothetical protein AURDEDRAFT_168119 [Auricularia subglabra TFB-10046 SS5]|nr:hypothetical protein AURDEDRAFT_168119 [Auricularia subglabra TFB-10046 SS5]